MRFKGIYSISQSGDEKTPLLMSIRAEQLSMPGKIKPKNNFLDDRKIFELPSMIVLSSDLKESGCLLKVIVFIMLW